MKTTTQATGLEEAIFLAITAPTMEQARQALAIAEHFGRSCTLGQLRAAKRRAKARARSAQLASN